LLFCFSTVDESCDQNRDKEAVLRERRPNGTNTDELLELMNETRALRRAWIAKDCPTISEIIRRYPRFQDLNSAVSSGYCITVHWIYL
jgi:hypothetical protein